MKKCNACMHWGSLESETPERRRKCERILGRDERVYGEPIEVPEDDKATVNTSAEYGYESIGWLETLADFGCVLHEPKEATP